MSLYIYADREGGGQRDKAWLMAKKQREKRVSERETNVGFCLNDERCISSSSRALRTHTNQDTHANRHIPTHTIVC